MRLRWMKKKVLYLSPVIISFLLAGCSLRGGGWIIDPTTGVKQATFGFHAVCDEISDEASGSISWHDQAANIKFYGVINSGQCGAVKEVGGAGIFYGRYTPQPKALGPEGGDFVLTVMDSGEPGMSSGDEISIQLHGGPPPYDGYSKGGPLGGGNIQASE